MNPTEQIPRMARAMLARLRSRALSVALAYAAFGTLWIVFSDRLLGRLVADPDGLVWWSVHKGLAFVAITTAGLLLLMRWAYGAVETGYELLKSQQREIERLGRLHTALSHVNQAIVRLPGREELFQRVCEVLVKDGGFRLAWVGWHEPATRRLVPAGVAGEHADYVAGLQVYVDDRPEGRGPLGRAFREDRPYISNELLNDPLSQPWRAELEQRGLKAAVALPVRSDGRVRGVLQVFAGEIGFFQEREVQLLREAAADIGFALESRKREEEARQAEALAASEREFSEQMIDSMPGVLYFYDTAGRFLRWNRNFERISGYTNAEISDMHPLDFFAVDDRPAVEERIAEVFARGESTVEAPFRAKDGRKIPYFFTGRRVETRGRTCLVGVGIDLSERKRAEAALQELQERLEVLVEHLREGLVIVDPATDFLHCNPAALRLLGYADVEEARRSQRDFSRRFALLTLAGEPLPLEEWPLARVRRGETLDRVEVRVRRRDAEWERIMSYSGSKVAYAGGRTLVFLALEDITERKEAEWALRQAKETLEHKVAERTTELQLALERAESADRIKSAFLASMSHELRTPLNSIIGFTGIVLQGLAGPLNAEQTKQLTMVRGSARHLLELINDVLDISKIEAGQLEVRADPFELSALIDRVMASMRPAAEKKQLALAVEVDPELGEMIGDRRRVEQILLNLVNNAIKFTERGQVTLTARLLRETERRPEHPAERCVRLVVADTGIGIKPADLCILFQPFRQIDAGLARVHEGTGLGLAICRRLATLMGGMISARSEWSQGSEFTVVLPLRPTGT